MTKASLSQISDLEDALATIDNRNQEWVKSRSPLGQFLAFAAIALRAGYEFPLSTGMKRFAGALYVIAEERDIRDQLTAERDQLTKQRQVMLHLENEILELVRTNGRKVEEWKKNLNTDRSGEGLSMPQLDEYYKEMIQYANQSSDRIVQAMKKVTTTAIDSEESLVFNDLQQHSSFVCFVQDGEHLRKQLRDAKQKRLEIERVRQDVLRDLEFLRQPTPLDNVHVAPRALMLENGSHTT